MKRTFSRLLALLLCLALTAALLPGATLAADKSGSCGPEGDEDSVRWTLDAAGTLTVSGTGPMRDFTWSDRAPWRGFTTSIKRIVVEAGVTSVGDGAFARCTDAAELLLPEGLTRIGNEVFDSCTSLPAVTIPASVTEIGESAFMFCAKLTAVTIPAGVTKLGRAPFFQCSALREIAVEAGNACFRSADGVLFSADGKTLLEFPGGRTGAYTIPDGVERVADSAFSYCVLTAVTVPPSVTELADSAFNETSLSSVQLAEGLRRIGAGAFSNCYSLKTVTVPDSVMELGTYAFSWCSYLETASIGKGITSVPAGTFYCCSHLCELTLPAAITGVGDLAFTSCDALQDVYFGGTEEEWAAITIGDWNDPLLAATVHFSAAAGFSLQRDGWCFVNGYEGFGYPSDYRIPDEAYETVFGPGYVKAAYDAGGKTFTSMIKPGWGGNCYGMSAAAVLFYLGLLDWSAWAETYTPTPENVNDYYTKTVRNNLYIPPVTYAVSERTSILTRLIEEYQILQYGSNNGYKTVDSTVSLINGAFLKGYPDKTTFLTDEGKAAFRYEHDPQGSYVQSVLDYILAHDEPLLVSISGQNFCHAIVIRNDRAPQDMGDGWVRVYVYDPNKPWMNEALIPDDGTVPASWYSNWLEKDTYIELNPGENKWRFFGSVNAGVPSKIHGCDLDGNVLYFCQGEEKEGETEVPKYLPEYFFVFSLSDSGIPTRFNRNEPWLERWKDELALNVTPETNLTVRDAAGGVLCTVADGVPAFTGEGGEWFPYIGATVDGDGSGGGRLVLPTGACTLDWEGGDDVTLLFGDTVLNLACGAEAAVDLSGLGEGAISLSAAEAGTLRVQLTEFADAEAAESFAAVNLLGELGAGGTVSLSLEQRALTLSGDPGEGGSLRVYADDTAHEEAVLLKTLTAPASLTLADLSAEEVYAGPDPRDLDGDGAVTAADAAALFRFVSGAAVPFAETAEPDVDGDGKVNDRDAILLFRLAKA